VTSPDRHEFLLQIVSFRRDSRGRDSVGDYAESEQVVPAEPGPCSESAQYPAVVGAVRRAGIRESREVGRFFRFDPPQTSVTTGVYASIRKSMQLAQTMVFAAWESRQQRRGFAPTSLIARFYSAGLAAVTNSRP